jgi:hypothetical protein
MVKRAFFLLRLNDHIQYLKKIEATLAGTGDFQGTSHFDCKLGKWLYDEGMKQVANMKDSNAKILFNDIFEPHELFHRSSKAALDKKQAGDHEGAKVAMTEMYKLSHIIVQKLLALDKLD